MTRPNIAIIEIKINHKEIGNFEHSGHSFQPRNLSVAHLGNYGSFSSKSDVHECLRLRFNRNQQDTGTSICRLRRCSQKWENCSLFPIGNQMETQELRPSEKRQQPQMCNQCHLELQYTGCTGRAGKVPRTLTSMLQSLTGQKDFKQPRSTQDLSLVPEDVWNNLLFHKWMQVYLEELMLF